MAHGTLFWRPDSDDDNEDDVKLHTERFAYRNKLGSGGFGAVWRVRDRWLKQDFALKISRTPMMQEMNVLRNMPRDYFINTFDYIWETGVHGYLMELMEPPWITLHEYFESFKRNAPRPRRPEVLVSMRRVKAALQVHIQLLTALSHLHGQRWGRVGRWCHADVKPMNTWVNSDVTGIQYYAMGQ